MFKNFSTRVVRTLNRAASPQLRKLRAAIGLHTKLRYTNFSIQLPADHLLPLYQKTHRLYDRFLPYLVKNIPPGTTVIDVGANCGDTLAAMYDANPRLTYVCIEPDDVFFEYLEKNSQRIRTFDRSASILLQKSLIGKDLREASLDGIGGTKHAITSNVPTDNKLISSVTLDAMLSLPQMRNVQLLKSDVDGYDYDVVDSAAALIKQQSPILFFECHFSDLSQQQGYERTISELAAMGYSRWVAFDNYGEVMVQTSDVSVIFQLFDYVRRQNAGRTTRTVVYFDILSSTEESADIMTTSISSYLDR